MVLRQLGRFDEAEKSLRTAIEFNPKDTFAHAVLGEALRQLGRLVEAENALRTAIELNPKYAFAHAVLSKVEKSMKIDFEHNSTDLGEKFLKVGKKRERSLSKKSPKPKKQKLSPSPFSTATNLILRGYVDHLCAVNWPPVYSSKTTTQVIIAE